MEEAIERANTNNYGLAAAVFTQDVGKVFPAHLTPGPAHLTPYCPCPPDTLLPPA